MDQFVAATSFIVLYGVSYGVVLFTLSIGLVLTLGLMRVLNLAHGAFAAIGGYIAVMLTNSYGVPFLAAALIAACIVAAFSVIVERVFYVPLYRANELDQVLMTIGLMFLTTASLNLVFGPDIVPARLPEWLSVNVDLGVRTFQAYRIFIVATGVVLILGLWLLFDRTHFGARLRAAVDNPGMAAATGINVRVLFSVAFALGSFLAAFGGAVGFALLPLEPLYPFKYLTLMLIIVALAGFGNVKASVGAAILVGVVDTASRYLYPVGGAFVVYGVFVLFMIVRPAGLLSGKAIT
ncbi:MAG: branched-chain amino acid ABC transporter permease [Burkholderiales bacterium]